MTAQKYRVSLRWIVGTPTHMLGCGPAFVRLPSLPATAMKSVAACVRALVYAGEYPRRGSKKKDPGSDAATRLTWTNVARYISEKASSKHACGEEGRVSSISKI